MKIVENMATLRAMERRGFVKFCNQTGEIIETLYSRVQHRCYYVDDGEHSFEYKGRKYGVRYFSGCFMPFVVEIEDNETIGNPAGIVLGL